MPAATYAPYALPGADTAARNLRGLQEQSTAGLRGLLGQDTSAERRRVEQAMYESSSRGVNEAADLARRQLLEGTFARGVGSSTITQDLAGELTGRHADALAQAGREAYIGAGSEQRADLASRLGLLNAGLTGGTNALQAEANVGLTNAARAQQAGQFGENLAFQGAEAAANRAQQGQQFGQNLDLQNRQLAQQGTQFGQTLDFQGGQAGLNRQLQRDLLSTQQGFQGSESALNRALQQSLLASQQGFQGTENQAARDLQTSLLTQQQGFQGTQNDATRALQLLILNTQLGFQGDQSEQNRALQEAIAQSSLLSSGISGGLGGLADLLGPMLFGTGGGGATPGIITEWLQGLLG